MPLYDHDGIRTAAATTAKRTGRKRDNNESSIRQRADGTWEARVNLLNGKRKSLYGKTRAEVARKLTEARRTLDRGLPVSTDRQTLSAYLDRRFDDCIKPARKRSMQTAFGGG